MNKKFLTINIKSLMIIAPDIILIKKIKKSFDLIKNTDKKEYKNIFSRLKIIFITNKNGYTNEFFMPERIWFTNKSLITNNNLSWISSLIIHDSFHSTQFKKGKYILPLPQLEKPALKVQEKFLRKINDKDGENNIKTVFKQKYWQKMANDKISFNYFRNLLNLFENNKLRIKKIK